ncbi:MAG: NAD(P)H-hydrate dehydratase, partial [Candidatus Micrarchaeia archaeon]
MVKPIELKQSDIRKMLIKRRPESHKGQNGRVLIVGGSWKYYGSPALVAKAALRAGADLAYLLVPDKIAPVVASYSPDFIVWGYAGHSLNGGAFELFEQLAKKTDALVIGNGLSKEAEALDVAARMTERWKKPLVIDADCLGRVTKAGALYTPHVVEFKRMAGEAMRENLKERCRQVAGAAKIVNGTVLLKGAVDVISDGKETALSRTGNAGMTCGGTGDTLAGICGAFLAAGS